MTQNKRYWLALKRAKAVGDRTADQICERIQLRKGLDQLDSLFALSHRAHEVYMRLFARYEATKPDSLRQLWN